jgi:hypothetical protein
MIPTRAFSHSKETTPADRRFGWNDDPRAVAEVVGRMSEPVAAYAFGREMLATEHRDVLLWEQGELALFDRLLPAHRQTIGDCVSHGWGRGIQDLLFIELARAFSVGTISKERAVELAVEIATEPVYAGSRVEIGRGRLGNGDGSIGAWAAEAVVKYGVLQRKIYGSHDLTEYSGALAKRWGGPRAGIPDELEPTAREHLVTGAPLVSTDDELTAALYNMYPVPFCSNRGFTEKRDQFGFCDPRGSWAHCMEGRGICLAKRGGNWVIAVVIQQSWGNNPTGPAKITLKDREAELPQGCFLVEIDVVVRDMLKARDSFAPRPPGGFVPRAPLFNIW